MAALTHTQLTHLGALCNHLAACFIAPPSWSLRNYNLAPGGAHTPCSVTWSSNSSGSSCSNAYQWEIHFLPDDFLEVIEGLFADGRLNATRRQDIFTPESGVANDFEVYLAGDFTVQMHGCEPSSEGDRYYYELSYTPATLRLFTLVKQEDLGNIRAALARHGVQLLEKEEE